MGKQAIYLLNGSGADPAIQRGLIEAGCNVICTHSIIETLKHFKSNPKMMAESVMHKDALPVVLVAEVQAGAIPLLILLHEQGVDIPPMLVFDRDGTDIRPAIRALQLGAREYILASDPEINRELCACILAERKSAESNYPADVPPSNTIFVDNKKSSANSHSDFRWDVTAQVIRIGSQQISLSPIEARVFSLLYEHRGQVVSVEDFITGALRKPRLEALTAARQLRPHMMRLRRKLNRYPQAANRLINTRGAGYMFV